ncbi:phosphate acetyltransferase [Kocuria sediminis]|uniref:Phosphate acetyltransferase n=1 Tax=Kocuria sediminis TaxID=1038857 RepID=A0A6N8GQL5_9MICC|nr:phosphate acetyltransferase [Kocuria sediminis]MUN63245.1 phosphate acetyltransferase [Kocuria sediminis]
MTQGIYVSAMTPQSGKSLVALGLADSLFRRTDRLGYFRPVHLGRSPAEDPMVQLMKRNFDLPDERCRGGLSLARTRELLAAGDHDELDSMAVSVYGEMARHCDVIVVDGTDLLAHNAATAEFDMNARMANNLGASVLAVIGADESESPEDVLNAIEVTRAELHQARCDIFAVIVNRARPEWVDRLSANASRGVRGLPVYVIAENAAVAAPTVAELRDRHGFGDGPSTVSLDRDVKGVKIAAMTVAHYLEQLADGDFVITPGDRSDIVVASLASALSPALPVPSGMLLTGGFGTEGRIQELTAAAPFPVLTTGLDTYSAARAVSRSRGTLSGAHPRKVAAALGEWARRVDDEELVSRLDLPRPLRRTPLRFLHELVEAARTQRKNIVLPEGEDPRILRAAEMIHRRNFCDLTILGDPAKIAGLCQTEGINLDFDDEGLTLIDFEHDEALREKYAGEYVRLRAHKGVQPEAALERMLDGSYFGTMMVQMGDVDGMVSGAAHTTANTIRPALEFVKTSEGVRIVSSVFFMLLEDRVLVYGDCAVNPNPDAQQLADIALASARTARQFGVEPRVAMLSYSTGGSGSGQDVDKVRAATEIVRAADPELEVEGPIQYDAAVDASIAASKLPGSTVAGRATVFVFPDLNTGNNTYKAVQQSAGAVAVGPVLQGLRKPVNDLSRGCTVDDIVNTVAITAIQAQHL